MAINIMALLKKEFRQGDHVIVIHDDTTSGAGELVFGKVAFNMDRCVIGGRELDWNHVLFMAHDGFPCRTLKLNLSNEQLYDIDNTELILLMRKLLVEPEPEPKPKPNVSLKRQVHPPRPERMLFDKRTSYGCGGGCPFWFEAANMQIFNPLGPVGCLFEETLVMTSEDGAKGFMWDIEEEVFDFAVI